MSAAGSVIALTLLLSTATSYRLVETLSGSIDGGDTKVYYTEAKSTGSMILLLCLDSIEGDADLYVSHSHSRPDYEYHDMSSTSTGIDVLVVSSQSRVYMGIYGHVRHNSSLFNLYILSPSVEEIKDHQVWEYNYETQNDRLVIDIDPLLLANDPGLHRTIEGMRDPYSRHHGAAAGSNNWFRDAVEWVLWVLVKLIEIGVEVVL